MKGKNGPYETTRRNSTSITNLNAVKNSLLFVFLFACSTLPEQKHKKYSFPKNAFLRDPGRTHDSVGVVRSRADYSSLDPHLDESALCENYFNKATHDLLELAKKNGADAVINVRSVVFLVDGKRETFPSAECFDDGGQGQVLVEGMAVKFRDYTKLPVGKAPLLSAPKTWSQCQPALLKPFRFGSAPTDSEKNLFECLKELQFGDDVSSTAKSALEEYVSQSAESVEPETIRNIKAALEGRWSCSIVPPLGKRAPSLDFPVYLKSVLENQKAETPKGLSKEYVQKSLETIKSIDGHSCEIGSFGRLIFRLKSKIDAVSFLRWRKGSGYYFTKIPDVLVIWKDNFGRTRDLGTLDLIQSWTQTEEDDEFSRGRVIYSPISVQSYSKDQARVSMGTITLKDPLTTRNISRFAWLDVKNKTATSVRVTEEKINGETFRPESLKVELGDKFSKKSELKLSVEQDESGCSLRDITVNGQPTQSISKIIRVCDPRIHSFRPDPQAPGTWLGSIKSYNAEKKLVLWTPFRVRVE